MVKRFNGQRHDSIICSNNENCNVSYLCTTSTHSGKGLVTRCVDKGDCTVDAIVIMVNLVRTDVLRDSAGFTLNDLSLTDCIKERCLTVIDVTHNSDNWWTSNEIIRVHIL